MAAQLTLTTAYNKDTLKSYKKNSYFSAPLKIGEPRSEDDRLHMIFMMASAGILNGDELIYDITCEKASKLLITEQSYSKLFDMGTDGSAKKHMSINVQKNASLIYRPCAVVPFKNSCFVSETDIRIDKGGEIFWSDIFTAGRVAMGESFAFRHYENRTRVWYDNELVWLDKCNLIPVEFDMTNMYYYRNYTHQGTCIYCGDDEKEKRLLDIYISDKKYQGVYAGITRAKKGVCVRALANRSQDIEELFSDMESVITG